MARTALRATSPTPHTDAPGRRHGWRARVALGGLAASVILPLAGGSASAALGQLYLDPDDPNGPGGLSVPGGAVWLGPADTGSLWVTDHLQGFCRIDPPLLNQASCPTDALGEPLPLDGQPAVTADGLTVAVPGADGVHTLSYDPLGKTVSDNGVLAGTDDPALLALRPSAVSFADGGASVLIGTIRDGNVYQVSSAGLSASPTIVGQTSDGGGVVGFATDAATTWIAEETGVSVLTAGTTASPVVSGLISAPTGIAAGGGKLFVAETPAERSFVVRHDIALGSEDVLADVDSALPVSAAGAPIYFASNMAVRPAGTGPAALYVPDDPGLRGGLEEPFTGRVFEIPDPATTEADGTELPAATGVKVATRVPGRVTAPDGIVKVRTTFWISDHARGICKVTNLTTLTPCVADAAGGGQLTYRENALNTNDFLYVPDGGAKGQGIVRLRFNGTTFVDRVLLRNSSAAGSLIGARLTSTAMGPDGKLYTAGLRDGRIWRITTPGSLTQGLQLVGRTDGDARVNGLAFVGGTLYVAEDGGVTKLVGAANCTGACTPAPTAVTSIAPTAIASGGNVLYVADTPVAASSVLRYTVANGAETPTLDPAAGAEQPWVTSGQQGTTTVKLQNVSALFVDPATQANGGRLWIGDDPSAGALVNNGRLWKADKVL